MDEFFGIGRVEDGRFPPSVRSGILRALHVLNGREVQIVIKPYHATRSNQQNRWLWGVAYQQLVEHYGYERNEWKAAKENLHYAMVERCFGTKWDAKLRAQVPKVRSSRLSTKEFSEYMDWLVRKAAEDGCVVPLPNEVDLNAVEDWEAA